jgi:hypothetical protein
MPKFFKKYKKIIYVLVAVILLFALYNFFFAGDDDGALLVSEVSGSGNVDVGREILASLLEIRAFKLDESIFENKGFKLLLDFSQEIESQPVGRPNPFSPIGIDVEIIPKESIPSDL